MKYTFCFMLIAFLSVSMTAQKGVKIEKYFVEVYFNSTFQWEDLDPIRVKLKEVGIELNYIETKFRKNGNLSYMSYEVDFGNGDKGSATYSIINEKTHFGLQRNSSENAKFSSRVGTLYDCDVE